MNCGTRIAVINHPSYMRLCVYLYWNNPPNGSTSCRMAIYLLYNRIRTHAHLAYREWWRYIKKKTNKTVVLQVYVDALPYQTPRMLMTSAHKSSKPQAQRTLPIEIEQNRMFIRMPLHYSWLLPQAWSIENIIENSKRIAVKILGPARKPLGAMY